MAIINMILGGVVLPGLVIDQDVQPFGVLATTTATLAGGMAVWEQAQSAGKQINIVGGADFGLLTRAALVSLAAMASTPNARYTLQTPTANIPVRFRNEEPPAVIGTPLLERPNPAPTDHYNNIQIKLMEV